MFVRVNLCALVVDPRDPDDTRKKKKDKKALQDDLKSSQHTQAKLALVGLALMIIQVCHADLFLLLVTYTVVF